LSEVINLMLILLFPLIFIIINLMLLLYFWNKNNYDNEYFKINIFKKNIIEEQLKQIILLKKESTMFDKLSSYIVNFSEVLLVFPENIIRLDYKIKNHKLLSTIEIFTFIKLIISIILFFTYGINIVIASYFLWRLLVSIITKLTPS
jgi:hypothetical protein